MSGYAADLADYVLPARKSAVLVITLDTTARAYDLRSLALGSILTPDPSAVNPMKVYLRLLALSANCHYHFDSTSSVTLDRTATIAAGGAIANATTYGDVLVASAPEHVVIERDKDMYIHVQGAGAGTLIIRASSLPA